MIEWWLTLALAQEPAALHRQRYAEARAAESELRYADAHAACTEAIRILSNGPRAATCRARLDWLEARRDADGGYVGLRALQAVRSTYRELDPDDARARVVALRQAPGVSALVSVDAGLWLAHDALERRGDAVAALAWTEPIMAEHTGELRKRAVGLHARALAELGRVEEATAVEDEIRVLQADPTRATPVQEVVMARNQRFAAYGASAALGLFAVAALPLAWKRRDRQVRPWGLVPIGVGTLGAWWIAEAWESGAGAAAPWMFTGFAAIHLVSGPALEAAVGWQRPLIRVLALLATAAAFLLALVGTGTLAWVMP